ncbi:hypothetical protein BDZ85DRAFT_317791 [Elsinoe ampelina]|uniref:Uncharacterized protein n=1 Tax=Elsinoe ampelina TaxID=302913 RepID=A0A6A6GIB0_9PEZI|nr:hypothetical protein BDZ85DRAFT_317791 [Elsinoe ampelina]
MAGTPSTWLFPNTTTSAPTGVLPTPTTSSGSCAPCTWIAVGPAYGTWTTNPAIPPLATTHLTVYPPPSNVTETSVECNTDVFKSYWTSMPAFGPYGYGLGNGSCSLTARILKIADSPGTIATGYVTAPSTYLDLGTNLYVRGGVSTTASDGSPSCLQSQYVSLSSRPPLYTGRIFPTNVTMTADFGSTTKTVSTELVYRLPDLTDYYPGQAAVEQCTLVKFDAVPNTFTAANYLTTVTTARIEFSPIRQPDPVFAQPPPSPVTTSAIPTGKQPRPATEKPPAADPARPAQPDITKLIPSITAIIGNASPGDTDQRGEVGTGGAGGDGNAGSNAGSSNTGGGNTGSGSNGDSNAGSQAGSGTGYNNDGAAGGVSSNTGSGNGQTIGDIVGGWIGAIIGGGATGNLGSISGAGNGGGNSVGGVAIPAAGPGGFGSSNNDASGGSSGNGPVRGPAMGAGSSGSALSIGPNRVVAPNMAPLTTQPAFYINNQLLTAGGPSIIVDGKPLVLDASGTTAIWNGVTIPLAQLAAVIGPAASVSSTSLLVYNGQTLLPGGTPVTVVSDGITQVLSMAAPTAPGATPRVVVLSQTGRDSEDIAALIMLGLEVAGASSASDVDDGQQGVDPLGAGWRVSAALQSQKSKSQVAKLATTFLSSDGSTPTPDAGSMANSGGGSSGPQGVASQGKAPLATGVLFFLFVATTLLM